MQGERSAKVSLQYDVGGNAIAQLDAIQKKIMEVHAAVGQGIDMSVGRAGMSGGGGYANTRSSGGASRRPNAEAAYDAETKAMKAYGDYAGALRRATAAANDAADGSKRYFDKVREATTIYGKINAQTAAATKKSDRLETGTKRQQVAGENRQNRDEGWLARQEVRERNDAASQLAKFKNETIKAQKAQDLADYREAETHPWRWPCWIASWTAPRSSS